MCSERARVGWYALETASYNSCGPPCQEMHHDNIGDSDDDVVNDDAPPPDPRSTPCFTANGAFGGVSITDLGGVGRNNPFETCYQNGNDAKYCWSQSHVGYMLTHPYVECAPYGGEWHSVDPKYVNPVTHPYSCGGPCSDFYCYHWSGVSNCSP